jgi:phosphoglycerol transferase MdoB-like AlkP superfamily enzyme
VTKNNNSHKLLEWIKKDYTVNVMLSQTVSKHLLNAMSDIENQLKEQFTEMKNDDPSSLSIELEKIKWQDLAIKVFQEYSKIELY